MKVELNINGVELKLDGQLDETVEFVQKLQAKQDEANSIKTAERSKRIEKGTELNAVLFDLWDYLADNDCDRGIPINAVARHFDIKQGCANQRLCRLVDFDYAFRVGQGRYRAKEK